MQQDSSIQWNPNGRQFANDGFYRGIIKEALFSLFWGGGLWFGFLELLLGFGCHFFLLPRKVSCHLTSPVSNPEPRKQWYRRTKTSVQRSSVCRNSYICSLWYTRLLKEAGEPPSASFFPLLRHHHARNLSAWLSTFCNERDQSLDLPPNVRQRKKKVVISNPDLSLSCFPMAKMGEQNTDTPPPLKLLYFTKGTEVTYTPAPSQAVLVPPCTPRCSPWDWVTLSNWPQLSYISSRSPLPILLPTKMCVVFPWRLKILQKLSESEKPR